MKRLYIYYPVFFLLGIFLLDKIFLLNYFSESFSQNGNPVYFAQRRALFQRMKLDPKLQDRKLALAFGDSRAYPYSNQLMEEKISKDWVVYNFAGPQAVPAYGFYWLRKIVGEGIVPKAVFYVVSPEAFNDKTGLLYDPFLRLGADSEFISTYWNQFPWEDQKKILLERLFTVKKVNPDLKLLYSRAIGGRLYQYDPAYNDERLILDLGRGEQFAYTASANDLKKLAKDAIRIKSIYLSQFTVNETEFFFVKEFLKICKERGIRAYLIWPRVYDGYRKGYYELGLDKIWWPKMEELAKEFGATSVDFNTKSSCDLYYDASHQSVLCLKEQMKTLMDDYYGKSLLK
ncbi:hypothetical protein CH373_10340 [Leptospira perolatii]|uniref:DUF1574 domain-containing protein n=1 Tax=Leptospira perolatii TaxID=2023191 RepID=A0A2M9ZN41_9LEPT|nr:DUF1574 domain-containing protein [Leptospira perolatii]PJZ70164.1 hypothetical protein CH360_08085 [Leptospira perolatii]PJZ73353.1 hypothetical protein CH373_10340 [Leptospira perolatii]